MKVPADVRNFWRFLVGNRILLILIVIFAYAFWRAVEEPDKPGRVRCSCQCPPNPAPQEARP